MVISNTLDCKVGREIRSSGKKRRSTLILRVPEPEQTKSRARAQLIIYYGPNRAGRAVGGGGGAVHDKTAIAAVAVSYRADRSVRKSLA